MNPVATGGKSGLSSAGALSNDGAGAAGGKSSLSNGGAGSAGGKSSLSSPGALSSDGAGAAGGKSSLSNGGAGSAGGKSSLTSGAGATAGTSSLSNAGGAGKSTLASAATADGAGLAGGAGGTAGGLAPSGGAVATPIANGIVNGGALSPTGVDGGATGGGGGGGGSGGSGNWNGSGYGYGGYGYGGCGYGGYGWGGYGWGGGWWGGCGWGGWWGGCGWGGWGWGFGWGWPIWSVGFNYSYYPSYYSDCSYSYDRCYDYYPYSYYSTVPYYPAYGAFYHSDANVTGYTDVSDPYVEFTDESGSRPVVANTAPDSAVLAEALRKPLYDGFPEMSLAELRMRAESWMKQGRYLEAAEARRRLLVIESTNPSLARDLGVALFAAERYELASIALNEALDRDPRVLASMDLSTHFGSAPDFQKTLMALERHVVKNSNDGSARFVLGVMDLSSGRFFAARNEFSLLKEAAPQNPHVGNLLAESDKKLLEAVPVEAPAETAPATR